MHVLIQSAFEEPPDPAALAHEPLVVHQRATPTNNQALVIFVHGLGGRRYGKQATWGQFPKYVYEDFPQLDIGLYDFRTLLGRLKFWESVSLETEAQVFAEIIRDARDYNTILLVGHSMGGLLCMGAICYLLTTHQSEALARLGGLVLMATPQTGSQRVPRLLSWFSKDFHALRPHGEFVTRIDETFVNALGLDESSVIPGKVVIPTWAVLGASDFWVDKLSAGLRLPAHRKKTVRGSHTAVVKPPTKGSDVYQFVHHCLQICLQRQVDASQDTGGPPGAISARIDLAEIQLFEGSEKATMRTPSLLPGADLAMFVGREEEIRQLKSRLTDAVLERGHRPIIITGMGGVGKTSLVRKVLEELWQEGHGDAAIYTEKEVGSLWSTRVASGTGAADFTKAVLQRIAGAFGYRGDSPADFLERQGSKILVVLDGADVEWSVLENLLERLAQNIVIVTTRTAVLNLVAYVPLTLKPFQEHESLTLFRAILATRGLTRDEADIRRICAQRGHLPLAIRAIASLVANYNLSLREVLIPGQLSSEAEKINQCFDLSYARLSEDEKRLFVLCSMFGGPSFSQASVRKLARALVRSPDSCLHKLIDLSLVNIDPTREEGRHSLHALVRHYARGKKEEVNWGRLAVDRVFLVRRLAAVCIEAMKEAAVPPPDDLDNAVTVIDEWCDGGAHPRVVVRIVDAVDNHLYRRGLWGQRESVLQQGIQAAFQRRARDQRVPRYLFEKGRTYSYQNRYSEAATALEESARLFETQGDAEQAARVYAELGLVYRYLRDWRTAKARLETGLRVLSDQPLTSVGQLAKSRCHINLADVFFDYGDEGNAERHLTEAEETLEPLKGRTAELPDDAISELADVIHRIGNVCFYSDQLYSDQAFEEDHAPLSERLQKAGEKYAEAITLLSLKEPADIKGKWVLAFCHDHQSQWCFRAAKLSEAEDHANRALHLFQEIGQRDGAAYSYDHLGECHMAKGYRAFTEGTDAQRSEAERKLAEAGKEYGQAAELFEKALRIFTELAKPDTQGWLLHHRGEVRENLGDLIHFMTERGYDQGTLPPYQVVWEQAWQDYTTALEIFKELGLKKYYLHLGLHLVEIRIKQRAGCLPPEADEYRRIVAGFFDKDFYRRLYGKPTQDAP